MTFDTGKGNNLRGNNFMPDPGSSSWYSRGVTCAEVIPISLSMAFCLKVHPDDFHKLPGEWCYGGRR
jgi:hypothetical protein